MAVLPSTSYSLLLQSAGLLQSSASCNSTMFRWSDPLTLRPGHRGETLITCKWDFQGVLSFTTQMASFPPPPSLSPHPLRVLCWFSRWSIRSVWLYLHTVWSPAPCQLVHQCAGTLCNKFTPPQQTSNLDSADFLNTPCRRLWHTWRFNPSLPVMSSMFLLTRTPQTGWDDAGIRRHFRRPKQD